MADNSSPHSLVVPEETVLDACGTQKLPRMGTIEQVWHTNPIAPEQIERHASEMVTTLELTTVEPGDEVAVGVGSRGIGNLPAIVRGVVSGLRNAGYEPFVFPAMGSHGGATADGQVSKLEALGVKEDSIGCEVRSTMETVVVGHTSERNVPVHADAAAAAADGIIPVNRVKPHTDFQGSVESGLAKMLVIGMGNQVGAKTAHEWAVDWSFRQMIPEIASFMLDALPILGGVAIVEDQRDETAVIEGVPANTLLERESALLERAYDLLPSLPFDDLDVLVVDQMGKDVSGAGMDTNVVGRRPYAINEPEPESPSVKRIYVRSLTDASHGNASGLGMADFIHQRLAGSADPLKLLINTLTSSSPRAARTPPVVETDRAGLTAALSTVGVVEPDEARILRISDTMQLDRLYASEALVREARERDDLLVDGDLREIEFSSGELTAPSPS
ncbi:DUF362 domain-containing protein [Halocatena marina]|uniref:DUF362 domain-containing protein n=1 Tax=Halocatena marina TaxID=2934937 RepID=UPI00200C6DB6|nr:DUF362 domain-containing protein [Halocatena marina]